MAFLNRIMVIPLKRFICWISLVLLWTLKFSALNDFFSGRLAHRFGKSFLILTFFEKLKTLSGYKHVFVNKKVSLKYPSYNLLSVLRTFTNLEDWVMYFEYLKLVLSRALDKNLQCQVQLPGEYLNNWNVRHPQGSPAFALNPESYMNNCREEEIGKSRTRHQVQFKISKSCSLLILSQLHIANIIYFIFFKSQHNDFDSSFHMLRKLHYLH